ncbi:hypothetical protein ACHWQZ_G019202 [Mnemiopsis leidyi]
MNEVQVDVAIKRQFKICVLGDSGVGKTCIIRRFVSNSFSETEGASVGAAYTEKSVDVDGVSHKLQIWDLAGQEHFRSLAPIYYRGAAAAILVFDLTYKNSFKSIENWLTELERNGPEGILLALVGNKADYQEEIREVFRNEIEEFARKHGLAYFETSAKLGSNVQEAFLHICRNTREAKKKDLSGLVGTSGKSTINLHDLSKPRTQSGCCNGARK